MTTRRKLNQSVAIATWHRTSRWVMLPGVALSTESQLHGHLSLLLSVHDEHGVREVPEGLLHTELAQAVECMRGIRMHALKDAGSEWMSHGLRTEAIAALRSMVLGKDGLAWIVRGYLQSREAPATSASKLQSQFPDLAGAPRSGGCTSAGGRLTAHAIGRSPRRPTAFERPTTGRRDSSLPRRRCPEGRLPRSKRAAGAQNPTGCRATRSR